MSFAWLLMIPATTTTGAVGAAALYAPALHKQLIHRILYIKWHIHHLSTVNTIIRTRAMSYGAQWKKKKKKINFTNRIDSFLFIFVRHSNEINDFTFADLTFFYIFAEFWELSTSFFVKCESKGLNLDRKNDNLYGVESSNSVESLRTLAKLNIFKGKFFFLWKFNVYLRKCLSACERFRDFAAILCWDNLQITRILTWNPCMGLINRLRSHLLIQSPYFRACNVC